MSAETRARRRDKAAEDAVEGDAVGCGAAANEDHESAPPALPVEQEDGGEDDGGEGGGGGAGGGGAGGGGEKPCCERLNRKKAAGMAKRANNYGVKSIVPPHAPKQNVMVVDVEDLAAMVAERGGACSLCRCYKSKKFPLCDGSHNSHNEATGDNAGPIVLLPEGAGAGTFPRDTEACACAQFSAEEAAKPVAGPRANNYGVVANTPADAPTRRVDKVGMDVVRAVVAEDGSAIMCRCFRSSTFPWCDGQHLEHNRECGDNIGPVVIRDRTRQKPAAL